VQGPPRRHRSPALRLAHVVRAVDREALQMAAGLRRGRGLARRKVVGWKGCTERGLENRATQPCHREHRASLHPPLPTGPCPAPAPATRDVASQATAAAPTARPAASFAGWFLTVPEKHQKHSLSHALVLKSTSNTFERWECIHD